jgi:hypothetical protein
MANAVIRVREVLCGTPWSGDTLAYIVLIYNIAQTGAIVNFGMARGLRIRQPYGYSLPLS